MARTTRRGAGPSGGPLDGPVELEQRRSRRLPVLVFLVLAGGSVASGLILARITSDQERRLLERRASEAALVVSSGFDRLTSSLPLVGALGQAQAGSPEVFAAVASRWSSDGSGSLAVIGDAPGGYEIVASSDGATAEGSRIVGDRARLLDRVEANDGVVTALDTDAGGRRRLLVAAAVPGSSGFVLAEVAVDDGRVLRSSASPFGDLDGALYVADRPDPDALLLSTASGPLLGDGVATVDIEVGADEWLLVARAREPLVGRFAQVTPWALALAGVASAALVALLVDTLSRRRAYAVALVAERTVELREALDDRTRLEERERSARHTAEAANRAKNEFLSRMSHELRTPLNAVLGFAQLLDDEDLSPENRDAVAQITKGGRHLLDLINEVLDIARIESGQLQLSPEPVLVADVLDEAVDLMRPLAASSGIRLVRSEQSACDAYVLADRQRLKQVVLNLVSNAIKYNGPGGAVELGCHHPAPHTGRISVSDTGPGIAVDDRHRLFVPFDRLGAEQVGVEGTGIGLALSRRLAEAMGGTVDLESEVGTGSTFWIDLPLVEGPVERLLRMGTEHTARPTPGVPAGGQATVLYIEDNLANLRLVELVVDKYEGVDLISAMQGGLGLDLAREHRPDLVLLDLHLPDMGGDVVLRQLRADSRTESIPVVVLSADATPGQIRRLLSDGAHAYLTKPVDLHELRSLLDSALRVRS